jgi:hypothetical protein
MDGGLLNEEAFEAKFEQANDQLQALALPVQLQPAQDAEAMEVEQETKAEPLSPEMIAQANALQLQRKYYQDALHFIHQLSDAIPVLCQLLSSTNKTEVQEAMDFFVKAHQYRIADAIVHSSVVGNVCSKAYVVWCISCGAKTQPPVKTTPKGSAFACWNVTVNSTSRPTHSSPTRRT